MDQLFDLTGKVALVTGGSRGLGLQMVRIAQRGADVVISSRKLDACEAAAEEMRRLGRRALPISATPAGGTTLIGLPQPPIRRSVVSTSSRHVASIPSHEIAEAMFDKIVSLNFKGPFR
jgi:NAD(P)-dependent dehydrogenase (short-subunit alcohol dehydrogenase family)